MRLKKKIFLYLFWIPLLVITSCSKNEDEIPVVSSSPLIKKIIKNRGGSIEVSYFKYDGNKLVSISNGTSFIANYTYTGNVITRIEETINNQFQNSMDYTYFEGKLATSVLTRSYGSTISYTYTHNTNGTISYQQSNGGSISSGILTLLNGNIVKNEVRSPTIVTYTYEYDTKNNPYKNILGFTLLINESEMYSPNNLTVDNRNYGRNYKFKYDTNGFPIERQTFDSSGNSGDLNQYFY
jgi:hypothetical protein